MAELRPVQSSEWMMAIRDYKFDLTVYEISVGALYGTCGNWGQKVFLSDVAISDITGMTRKKAGQTRKKLLALGLIEDIGQHGSQPSQREYRLTLPAEMPPLRMEGDGSQGLRGWVPGTHPDGSQGLTPMGPRDSQQLDLELEQDLDPINITPGCARDDGGDVASQEGQDQNQAPAGPCPAGAGEVSPADGEAEEPTWTGDGEVATDNRDWLAGLLGVPVGSIGAPLWRWLESLGTDETHAKALVAAARKAAEKDKPVGYFRSILPVEIGAEVNGSSGELLEIEPNGSSETFNGSSGSFNSSSETFNGSPGELTTSQENIQKNIPTKSDGRSPTGKTGPSAQESGSPQSLRAEFDSILAECPSAFLAHWGGSITVRQVYGYWDACPDVARLREDLSRFQADAA